MDGSEWKKKSLLAKKTTTVYEIVIALIISVPF